MSPFHGPPQSSRARARWDAVTLTSVLALLAGAAPAQHAHTAGATAHLRVSCTPPARAEFDRGLTLLHHMTYPEARTAFARTAALDPRCAMAHWGVAMTLFQPLWPTRPGPADLQRGFQETQAALALHAPTARESLLVASAAAFYQDPASTDYWSRIGRWESGMRAAYDAMPNDIEVASLYALAHLATTPPTDTTGAHQADAATILLAILARQPDHPGALHYLVHASDAPGRERTSLRLVRRYERVAPDNPHALHMPTHVYVRLGEWDETIRGNRRAASAALKFPAGPHGEYVWDEYAHAMEYLVYALLQRGDDQGAAAAVARLRRTTRLEPSFKTAFHLASTSARDALERHAWTDAAALVPREPSALAWDRFPWAEAVTWFARGLGAAHLGQLELADSARRRLLALDSVAHAQGEESFAREIRILRLEVASWTAHARQDDATAFARMDSAVDLERTTPKPAVTPAPTIPALELLADLQADAHHPEPALAAYEQSLALYPRRFNSLAGALASAHAVGNDSLAARYARTLLEVAAPSSTRAQLAQAREVLRASRARPQDR